MQTYDEIVQSVQAELMTAEGMRLMGIRRKAVYDIAKIMPEFRERMLQLINTMAQDDSYKTERELTELTVNQSTLKPAIKGDFRVNMEIRGNNCGTLSLPRVGSNEPAMYSPRDGGREMIWGADETRDYIIAHDEEIIDKMHDKRGQSQSEHLRKKRIVEHLLENPDAEGFKGLQLLLPAGCNMEHPTTVNAQGQVNKTGRGHGHIDMLFKAGVDDAPTLVIGELKDMRDNTTTPFQVLRQAIIYAAALGAEINGLDMGGQKMGAAKRDAYSTFFDIPESAFEKPIGVAAIVPDHSGAETSAIDAMKFLRADKNVRLDVMLYDEDAGMMNFRGI